MKIKCPTCGVEGRLDENRQGKKVTCPKCRTKWVPNVDMTIHIAAEEEAPPSRPPARVDFKVFRSSLSSWDSLCAEAAGYATTLGRDSLISISHSCAQTEGVITVWYWED